MNLSHEEFQKARRIGRAIQTYLEEINDDDLRSTDLYPILARKKLIEKDKGNGVHFRRFLRKLKDNNLLYLIPQCKFKYSERNPSHIEWHFYRVKKDIAQFENNNMVPLDKIITPKISEEEINELIKKAKPHIQKLPKRNIDAFTYPQVETRKLYSRAYEYWTDREIEIMCRAYKKFERIDKVAELLERQPSIVEIRLRQSNLIK